MIRQLAPERPAAIELTDPPASPTGMVAAAAAVRGAAVAVSGAILAAGLALVLWAVTPASGADPAGALQGGVVAFASANLMPVTIGGVLFTLPPLLLTLVLAALLTATARRGRFLPQGRYQETVSVAVTATVYGLVVAAVTRGLGPPAAVPAGWVWTAAALALVATSIGMLGRGSAWRRWWQSVADDRLRIGVRGAGIGFAVLIAGGGLALSAALIVRFGTAIAVASIAAPSWSDGLGMAMLGLAYLPNAIIAGAGYVTGAGFEIGPGTYSPFATATVDLPAVPLLAAAPDQSGRSLIGLTLLAVPVLAGYLVARTICRHLPARFDRMVAAAVAGVLTGALLGATAAIARGGVADGRWATIGSPPLLLGALAAVEVGIVAVAVCAVLGGRDVPWRVAVADAVDGASARRSDGTVASNAATADATEGDDSSEVDLFDSELFTDRPSGADAVDEAPVGDDAEHVDEVVDDAAVIDEPADEEHPAADGLDTDTDTDLAGTSHDVADDELDHTEAAQGESGVNSSDQGQASLADAEQDVNQGPTAQDGGAADRDQDAPPDVTNQDADRRPGFGNGGIPEQRQSGEDGHRVTGERADLAGPSAAGGATSRFNER